MQISSPSRPAKDGLLTIIQEARCRERALESEGTRFKPWLHHLLAVFPWDKFVNVSDLTGKMRILLQGC